MVSASRSDWKRPIDEVTFLMEMYVDYLRQELPTMMEHNIRFRQIGRLENLPPLVLDEMNVAVEKTAESFFAVCNAARFEITTCLQRLVQQFGDALQFPRGSELRFVAAC